MIYTHGHHDSVLRSHRWRSAANSAAYLLPALGAGMEIIDVGCGPGTITVDLAVAVAPGRTVGIDASDEALVAARAEAARRGVDVGFVPGDAYDLNRPDASVDVVHAHQVLQHLADPVAALREWARVCRTGGLVAARDADYAAMTWYPELPLLDRWRTLYHAAATANGGQPDAGRRLLAWAHQADLTDVAASASVWCFATPADRDWWAGTWAERIVGSTLAAQITDRGLADEDELATIAAAWREWAAHRDAWFLVPHGEILARIT